MGVIVLVSMETSIEMAPLDKQKMEKFNGMKEINNLTYCKQDEFNKYQGIRCIFNKIQGFVKFANKF